MAAVLVWGAPAGAQPSEREAAASLSLVQDGTEAAREGAVLFAYHCAACHGATGRGVEEARTAFPPDHRTCVRCHRPGNPTRMPAERMQPNDAFDVGTAPALLGPDAGLERFGNAAALGAYVRATMPRPFPGSLSDGEYDRIVAFLGEADGGGPPTATGPGGGEARRSCRVCRNAEGTSPRGSPYAQ